MSVEIREDNTREAVDGIADAISRALEEIGLTAEGYAVGLCPVDTGRLRNSITHEIDEDGKAAYIGTNVEYAPYIELGTRRYVGANGGRGFLRPAATEHGDEYRKILESELKGK